MNDAATESQPAPLPASAPESYAALPAKRRAGVCMHLSSLPGDYGIGEIGVQARQFVDLLAETGLLVWQFLPLGPTGYGDSPYQSLSTFAGNEMLIDLRDLVELGLLKPSELELLKALPRDRVAYGELIPLKSQLLALAARRFEERAGEDLKAQCEAFVAEHGRRWLNDYALYRILKYRHGHRAWTEWDRPFVRRDPEALAYVEEISADRIAEIKIIQFLFYDQWQRLRTHAAERGVQLFGDMPIYIAFDSADAWGHNELLRIDVDGRPNKVAGVPPDYYSEDGQLWGNPLYDWAYHAAHGYRWWIDRVRHAMSLMDLVRIDHFRAFNDYWAIPKDAKSAREGAWEDGPGDAFFEALRAGLGSLPIIAEDLGEPNRAVDELRDRQRFPGMKVLQFLAGDPEFDPNSIPAESVCYTSTHDNDTARGWFEGGPGDVRTVREIQAAQRAVLKNTRGKAATIHLDLIRLGFGSKARLAIALMQDFLGLGSEARMNTPGTSANNWQWRATEAQLGPELRATIRKLVTASGRA